MDHVSLSSYIAELNGYFHSFKESSRVRNLCHEIGFRELNPVRLIQGDNEKGISFISQESEGSGAKHAHLRLYYMQEELQTGTAEVEWIPGADLCTDSMTKVCDEDLFVTQRANYMGHGLLSEPWRRASEC